MNYKQSSINTETWQRANRVVIDNQFNTTPTYNFVEEQVIGEKTFPIGNITGEFDPTKEFNLLDDNGNVIRVATMDEIRQLLASLYLHLANERDNQS